jgi:hypothetical protein
MKINRLHSRPGTFAPTGARIVVAALASSLSILGIANTASAAVELVANGGFEQPIEPSGSYTFVTSIPDWTLAPSSLGNSFEVRDNFNTPYEGKQFIELNSNNTTSIFQDLTTVPGDTYQLSFAFSPRPGFAQNIMRVYWEGNLVDTLSASGVGNTDSAWQVHSYTLTATGGTTRLAFDDLLETNALPGGSHLDAVSVQSVPEPSAGLMMLAGGGALLLTRRKRNSASRPAARFASATATADSRRHQ